MSEQRDYRVKITIRNNLLLSAVEDAGYTSMIKFSKAFKLNYTLLMKYLGLKYSPLNNYGEIRPSAELLCSALNKNLHDLFPERFMDKCLERNSVDVRVNEEGLARLAAPGVNPEQLLLESDANAAIHKALGGLRPRYAQVLVLKWGLFGEEPRTNAEIAELLHVSPARVIQMVDHAIRTLRDRDEKGRTPGLSKLMEVYTQARDERQS